MKNIPMFTGQYGLASLILKEVPFSGRAYILVRAIWNEEIEAFLQECAGFCRAVGAEEVFASYETAELPGIHSWDVLAMEVEKDALPNPDGTLELEPLTPENGEIYLEIYNCCFREVSGAASYDRKDLERLYDTDCAYLAKVEGEYAAVAEISREGLESIGVLPRFRGLGYELMRTVLPMVPKKTVKLRVSGDNPRAMALYERLGFVQTGIVSRWWKL